MGGGGAMRSAAAKVAGFGVFRGVPTVPIAENSVATVAGWKNSRPVSVVASSVGNEDGKSSSVLVSSQSGKMDALKSSVQNQKPAWEIDDWELAGVEDELLLDSMNPMPRVVFGSVPTPEEAKEATSELKDALEKVYFPSSNDTGGGSTFTIVQGSSSTVPLNSGYSETKACITSDTAVARRSVPNHAVEAFLLLKESTQAQSVVASLATDKNVWDAVMQNDKVLEFIRSQRSSAIPREMDMDVKESFADKGLHQESVKGFEDRSDEEIPKSSKDDGFMEYIKLKVAELVSNISGFIQSIFGRPAAGNTSSDADGSATNADKAIGASLMALAVLVIMVVVLKRV